MKKSEKIVVEQVLCEANILAEKQADFNENYIVKANDALYALLGEIMGFGDMVLHSPLKLEILSKMRSILSREHRIKTQRNSSDVLIIVKYIVRTSRKNAHVYARVLELAYQSDVMPDELPDFIREHGGIDRIRESNINIQASVQRKELGNKCIEFITAFLNENAKTPFTSFDIPKEFENKIHDMRGQGRFFYPVCSYDKGSYKVVGVVPMHLDFEIKLLERVYQYLTSDTSHKPNELAHIETAKWLISSEYKQELKEKHATEDLEYKAIKLEKLKVLEAV